MRRDRRAVARGERREPRGPRVIPPASRDSLRSSRATVAVCLLSCALSAHADAAPPSFVEVKASYVSSEALLLDRHGIPLSELRVDPKVRRLDWVPLAEISPAMAATLIAAELSRKPAGAKGAPLTSHRCRCGFQVCVSARP